MSLQLSDHMAHMGRALRPKILGPLVVPCHQQSTPAEHLPGDFPQLIFN